MKLIKIIKFAYIAFSLYALFIIDVTSLHVMDIMPAVLIMWLIYIVFTLGYKSSSKKITTMTIIDEMKKESWILNKKKATIFTISILSVMASILAARFYTGQNPLSVFTGLLDSNRSIYAEYQQYAMVQNIGTFTILKIPFILMMFYTKLVLFYFGVTFLLIKEKTNLFDKLCLFLVIAAHIYFGLSRGTNYELFEIVILFIFITLSKKSSKKANKRSTLKLFSILTSVGIMIFLFYQRISSRGYVFNFMTNSEFTYNPQGIISIISSELAFVVILLYDYFGFGFYYISYYTMNIWLTSVENIFSGLIPYGYYLQTNEMITEIVRKNIFINARWHPDIILTINVLGVIGVFILLFTLGRFTRFITNKKSSSFTYLTEFIILMQMISLPIGNFVFVSSASTLIVMLLVYGWFWRIFINKKVRLNN